MEMFSLPLFWVGGGSLCSLSKRKSNSITMNNKKTVKLQQTKIDMCWVSTGNAHFLLEYLWCRGMHYRLSTGFPHVLCLKTRQFQFVIVVLFRFGLFYSKLLLPIWEKFVLPIFSSSKNTSPKKFFRHRGESAHGRCFFPASYSWTGFFAG